MAFIEHTNPSTDSDHPRIGVALGSGAARGWAHIGVLRALAEANIHPDVIAGTSIGSLVGGAAAAGCLEEVEAWVRNLDWWEIAGYVLEPGAGGLVDGERLMRAYAERVGERNIEDLEVTFGAVATELDTGREVWFREGSLTSVVRASIALPGLFAPVLRGGAWLVDGGVVDPVPVSLCRALGADLVIAVNLNTRIVGKRSRLRRRRATGDDLLKRIRQTLKDAMGDDTVRFLERIRGARNDTHTPRTFDVITSAMNVMQDRITRSRMAGDPPEVMLTPRLEHIALMEFDRAGEAIDEGIAAVVRQESALAELLDSANNKQV